MTTPLNLLDNCGIIGWDEYEPVILASLLTGYPMMLVGSTGTGKTKGVRKIAETAYGDIKYHSYNCPALHPDDLTGQINLKAYGKGRIEYLTDGDEPIWDQQVVLLDELSRTNPAVGMNQLLTYVDEGTWGGKPTASVWRCGAMNPPHTDSTANYLGSAMADRWVCIFTPSLLRFTKSNTTNPNPLEDFSKVLFSNIAKDDSTKHIGMHTELIEGVQNHTNKFPIEREKMAEAMYAIADTLNKAALSMSVRRLQRIVAMVDALCGLLDYTKGRVDYFTPKNLAMIVLSNVPELFGVVSCRNKHAMIMAEKGDVSVAAKKSKADLIQLISASFVAMTKTRTDLYETLELLISRIVKSVTGKEGDVSIKASIVEAMLKAWDVDDILDLDASLLKWDSMPSVNIALSGMFKRAIHTKRYMYGASAAAKTPMSLKGMNNLYFRKDSAVVFEAARPVADRSECSIRLGNNSAAVWVTSKAESAGVRADPEANVLLISGDKQNTRIVYIDGRNRTLIQDRKEKIIAADFSIGPKGLPVRVVLSYPKWRKYGKEGIPYLFPNTPTRVKVIGNPTWEDGVTTMFLKAIAACHEEFKA